MKGFTQDMFRLDTQKIRKTLLPLIALLLLAILLHPMQGFYSSGVNPYSLDYAIETSAESLIFNLLLLVTGIALITRGYFVRARSIVVAEWFATFGVGLVCSINWVWLWGIPRVYVSPSAISSMSHEMFSYLNYGGLACGVFIGMSSFWLVAALSACFGKALMNANKQCDSWEAPITLNDVKN